MKLSKSAIFFLVWYFLLQWQPPQRSLDGYKHVVDVEYCPPVSSEGPQFPPEAAKAKEAAQSSPNMKNTAEYHDIIEGKWWSWQPLIILVLVYVVGDLVFFPHGINFSSCIHQRKWYTAYRGWDGRKLMSAFIQHFGHSLPITIFMYDPNPTPLFSKIFVHAAIHVFLMWNVVGSGEKWMAA